MAIQPGAPRPLRPGMVFHLVPHVELPAEGVSVGSGETVLITQDGYELLTRFERHLLIRPV